jgi:hypothetical protein
VYQQAGRRTIQWLEKRTSVDNVLLVEIVDGIQYLTDGLRRVFLRELAVVANPVEQLAAGCQLCDNVEFVLVHCQIRSCQVAREAHLGLEPVDKRDNVRVLKLLQHLQLVVDHALVAADVLLENNLDRNLLAILGLGLTNDTICACTECASEPVQGPVGRFCLSA